MPPGTLLTGKWNGRIYKLERLLGTGSNGHVYLASYGRSACAVKLGKDVSDLQAEANILASLDHREKGAKRRPFLLDVDDAVVDGAQIPFYAMQYVPGVTVRAYLRKHGPEWAGIIGYRLLRRLSELHDAGWIFSDLKNDNLLVSDYGQVALVDYGGMTANGRGIRQFTEIYDRGYWSAGSRTAEPSYDWFSAAVLWIHVLDEKRLLHLTRTLLPQNRDPGELLALVKTNSTLKPLSGWFEKALRGKFASTQEAAECWREAVHGASRAKSQPSSRIPAWMAGVFAVSLLLCVSLMAIWLFG
ncbi:serine/threonine protein kinase [Cohnella fermenti]|uniref:non-specific serine/threonine protein kinase n=1 Tax=Cohnella fermenti TaxID=2565925 RepID=A0A4S4BJC6_9BACL|nr:serine/threonine protein kinase [Cohnella fermenti]